VFDVKTRLDCTEIDALGYTKPLECVRFTPGFGSLESRRPAAVRAGIPPPDPQLFLGSRVSTGNVVTFD
jgi:hypothetical protein